MRASSNVMCKFNVNSARNFKIVCLGGNQHIVDQRRCFHAEVALTIFNQSLNQHIHYAEHSEYPGLIGKYRLRQPDIKTTA